MGIISYSIVLKIARRKKLLKIATTWRNTIQCIFAKCTPAYLIHTFLRFPTLLHSIAEVLKYFLCIPIISKFKGHSCKLDTRTRVKRSMMSRKIQLAFIHLDQIENQMIGYIIRLNRSYKTTL